MIEINLLPEELKDRIAKAAKPQAPVISAEGWESKHFILLIPLVFGLLISAQLIIAVCGIIKSGQLRSLKARLNQLEPQRKAVAEFNNEYILASGDKQAREELERSRIIWSEKLNKLSLNLPAGVWFSQLSANKKELILKGKVISLSKDELGLIKQLIDNLKDDPLFYRDFNSIEMVSAEKKNIGSYEVTEFSIKAALKTR